MVGFAVARQAECNAYTHKHKNAEFAMQAIQWNAQKWKKKQAVFSFRQT